MKAEQFTENLGPVLSVFSKGLWFEIYANQSTAIAVYILDQHKHLKHLKCASSFTAYWLRVLRCHSLCAEYFYLYTDDDRRKMIRGIGGISIKSEATSSV